MGVCERVCCVGVLYVLCAGCVCSGCPFPVAMCTCMFKPLTTFKNIEISAFCYILLQ